MNDPQDLIAGSSDNISAAAPAPVNMDIKTFEAKIRTLAQANLPGPNYLQWIDLFHKKIEPKNYLEIGIASGGSLARIRPETRSIGVDPAFNIQHTIQSPTRLYRETSDDFFKKHNATKLFGSPVDLSFVDGLHTFDQTFRDVVNVSRHSHDKTVILVHDVLPLHEIIARRDRVTNFWTGDVWKIGWMLKELMPGVEFKTIPTYPSGLMVLKNVVGHQIDPESWLTLEMEVMARPFPSNAPELKDVVNLDALPPDELFAWALGA
mgnify:CR=1 FL=1